MRARTKTGERARSVVVRHLSLFGAALTLALGAACSDSATDSPTAPPPRVTGPREAFVVASASSPGSTAPTVYVSLPPGAIPSGSEARLRVVRTGATALAQIVDGGFDPVTLGAAVGDQVAIAVQAADTTTTAYLVAVPRPNRPVIVRTNPPAHKRDVPLNATMVVVFSQPIDAATLTSSTVLLRRRGDGTAVAGRLGFADAAHLTAQFVPATPLDAGVEYELVVTQGIRDVHGLALEGNITVPFSTATAGEPPAAGTLQVSTATSGADQDPDGYALRVFPTDLNAPSTLVPLPTSTTTARVSLTPGRYAVALEGTAGNCGVTPQAASGWRLVDVAAGATASVSFAVACVHVAQTAPASVGQVAFVRNGQIHLVNSDGGGLVQLTNTAGGGEANGDPAWSPDGKRIAFWSNGGGRAGLYVMNADGSNVVRRTSSFPVGEPTWSPDGLRIAFSALLDEVAGPGSGFSSDLYSVTADGAETVPVRLTRDRGWEAHPAWSPDGRTIAFSSDFRAYDIVYDLYAVNADGSGVTPLAQGPFFAPDNLFYFQPAWSPDGRKLAVVTCAAAWDTCSASAVSVMNADGSGVTMLTPTSGYARPTWSPDGRTIAFATAGSIQWVSADGSQRGTIVPNGNAPAWRP